MLKVQNQQNLKKNHFMSEKKMQYPSLRRTRFRALSSSLKAKAVEDRIVFFMDFILADSSCLA